MKITDLNGCQIEVVNLEDAIKIAEEYKQNEHINKVFSEFDKRLKVYWTDMFEKLTVIKKRLNDN